MTPVAPLLRHALSRCSPVLLVLSACASEPEPPGAPVRPGPFPPGAVWFVPHRVGTFRGEACEVADFNGDGKLDIVAGPYVYLAPDWTPVKIRTLRGEVDREGKGYWWDFMNAPLDVDGDGLPDVVSCSWHGMESSWFRNTGPGGGEWPETRIEKNGNFECGERWDIDGDGKRNEILPHVMHCEWYEVGAGPDGRRGIVRHLVSDHKTDYGGGVGDVNGDGRPDILKPGAWYEAPPDPRTGAWKEHPLAVGCLEEGKVEHTPQIWVTDVNGDGLNDIVTSSAHRYGIFWYEQLRDAGSAANPGQGTSDSAAGGPRWKQHVIDRSWSQAHNLTLADFDNDGDPDIVTGKRFMAHNGGDPEEYAPLGLYWYELRRGNPPTWVKHVISYDQGIGAGMYNPVVDLDGDGDLDIVVTGKWGGPVWFENKAR